MLRTSLVALIKNLFTTSYKDEAGSLGERYTEGSRSHTLIPLDRSRSDKTAVEKGVDDELENRESDGGAVHLRAKDSVRAEIDLFSL